MSNKRGIWNGKIFIVVTILFLAGCASKPPRQVSAKEFAAHQACEEKGIHEQALSNVYGRDTGYLIFNSVYRNCMHDSGYATE